VWRREGVEERGCGGERVWRREGVEERGCGGERVWRREGVEERGCGTREGVARERGWHERGCGTREGVARERGWHERGGGERMCEVPPSIIHLSAARYPGFIASLAFGEFLCQPRPPCQPPFTWPFWVAKVMEDDVASFLESSNMFTYLRSGEG
jgi:hypothetical protein